MEKTMNLTKSILEIAGALMSKYAADIDIRMIRRDEHFYDDTLYVITVQPWGSELCISVCVTDFDIRNTKVLDLISLKVDDAAKRLEEKKNS